MPLLSEAAWIWEALKLLLRFAPHAEKFITRRVASRPEIDGTGAEIYQQLAGTQASLEAQLNDLRRQAQEQNLKLNQIHDEMCGLQQQLEASLTLVRETRREIAALGLWLWVTAGTSLLIAILVLILLFLRH